MADPAHPTKMTSWITVLLVFVACIVLGAAMVAQSVVTGVIGGVLLVGGIVLGITGKIMDDAH